MRNINENGRSMVEMLGVLAIIGVLSAGGLAGYSKAMFKHKLNNTIDQITMLATSIRTYYGEQGNYNGLSNTKATKLGIVPAAMLNNDSTGATLVSPFNGTVIIQPAKANAVTAVGSGETATAFVIAYNKLPQEACVALATADFGSGAGSGFLGVDITGVTDLTATTAVTGSTAVIGGTSDRAEGKAYSIATASGGNKTHCAANSNNAITWKFY